MADDEAAAAGAGAVTVNLTNPEDEILIPIISLSNSMSWYYFFLWMHCTNISQRWILHIHNSSSAQQQQQNQHHPSCNNSINRTFMLFWMHHQTLDISYAPAVPFCSNNKTTSVRKRCLKRLTCTYTYSSEVNAETLGCSFRLNAKKLNMRINSSGCVTN